MRSPSFHWPRFLRSSVRSRRLRTLRLPPSLDAARRLRCCDINRFWLNFQPPKQKADGLYIRPVGYLPMVNLAWQGCGAPQPQYQGGAAATALPTLHRVIAATTSIPATGARPPRHCGGTLPSVPVMAASLPPVRDARQGCRDHWQSRMISATTSIPASGGRLPRRCGGTLPSVPVMAASLPPVRDSRQGCRDHWQSRMIAATTSIPATVARPPPRWRGG